MSVLDELIEDTGNWEELHRKASVELKQLRTENLDLRKTQEELINSLNIKNGEYARLRKGAEIDGTTLAEQHREINELLLQISVYKANEDGIHAANTKLRALLTEKYEIYLQNCAEIDKLNTALNKARTVIEQVKHDGDVFDHLRGFAGYIQAANYLAGE